MTFDAKQPGAFRARTGKTAGPPPLGCTDPISTPGGTPANSPPFAYPATAKVTVYTFRDGYTRFTLAPEPAPPMPEITGTLDELARKIAEQESLLEVLRKEHEARRTRIE